LKPTFLQKIYPDLSLSAGIDDGFFGVNQITR
jgi:hypothetical protein